MYYTKLGTTPQGQSLKEVGVHVRSLCLQIPNTSRTEHIAFQLHAIKSANLLNLFAIRCYKL